MLSGREDLFKQLGHWKFPRPFSKWQTRLINNRWQKGKEGAVWVTVSACCCGAKLIMQPYWMSAEMSSPAMVMMKYQNLLRYLWRMPPPSLWPTMPYLSKQENKRLTSWAWHNVARKKKVEINKAFVMLYLYGKKQQGFTTRRTAGSAMNHLSECEMSAEWPFVESRSRSLPPWQYSISNESGYRPGSGGHSESFTPPTPSLHFLPPPFFIYHHGFSIRPHWGTTLVIPGTPCNTTECYEYRNMLSKCYQMQIFSDISDAEREGSRWHAHNKQKAQLDNGRKVTTSPPGRQTRKHESIPLCFCIWSLTEWHETPPPGCCCCLASAILPKGHISIHFKTREC